MRVPADALLARSPQVIRVAFIAPAPDGGTAPLVGQVLAGAVAFDGSVALRRHDPAVLVVLRGRGVAAVVLFGGSGVAGRGPLRRWFDWRSSTTVAAKRVDAEA
ncbi:hypothetical protein AB0B89_31475, partial [Sphaerisporangium sp. NPDC049002]|uniref:hypothetical protein n=1 Tax=Sphaerisporangium sp. NPDC049002 TaxID=3155392 RepID=UPI003403BF8B